MLANAQFSSPNLGVLFSGKASSNLSAAHGIPISHRPWLAIASNPSFPKKILDLDARTASFRAFCVLVGEDARRTSSSSVQLLENDIKFTPTFRDYVNVMESVKIDRSKLSSADVDVTGSKKRPIQKNAKTVIEDKDRRKSVGFKRQLREKEDSKNVRIQDGKKSLLNKKEAFFRRTVEGSGNRELRRKPNGSGWGLVEGILEKRAAKTRNTAEGCIASDDYVGYCVAKDLKNSSEGKVDGTGKNAGNYNSMDKDISRRNVGMKIEVDGTESSAESVIPIKRKFIKKSSSEVASIDKWRRNSFLRDDVRVKIESYAGDDRSSLRRKQIEETNFVKKDREVLEMKNNNARERIQTKHRPKNHFASQSGTSDIGLRKGKNNFSSIVKKIATYPSKDAEIHGFHQTHRSINVVRSGVKEQDFEDRAAFKTFEVFNDVKNRPRVLRMEMEERIQQLAKQLHTKDINIPQWQFSEMIHSAKIRFTDHSILRVVQILGAFGNWRRVLQVVEWLQSRERFKSLKSRYIYTSVLSVLGKAKRPFEALNIFYAMRQELSSYPDLAAYHCIAVTLGQAGFLKELFDVIDCMRAAPEKKFKLSPLQKWDPRLEPDIVIYNSVLNACVQQKHWEGAFWVLQQLKQQGIKSSNTTYGLVMEVMLACGKYNLVYEFFRKAQKNSIPGALNYKVLVNALWKEGKIDEAVQAVKDMERRGVIGSASLYYDLARCLCSAGRCKEALVQIDKLCKVANKPLVVTFTGLIQSCLDSGSIENAAFIFNEMQKFCSPNIVTCNIILKSYIEHEKFEEAKELFYKILDSSHQILSKADLSEKIVPDKFTFNTMIEVCAKTNRWGDFENAFGQMLNHGYHFDTRRHLRLVLDAYRAGKVDILELTWDHLLRFDRVPPPSIIKERFCAKLMENNPAAAVSCLRMVQNADIHAFSVKSLLEDILDGRSHQIGHDNIVKLDNELKFQMAEGGQLNPVSVNLANACKELLSPLKIKHDLSNVPEM